MLTRTTLIAVTLAAIAAAAPLATAENVDLVTLPKRDTVQLTIYNSEDLTLVRETRHVTVKKGANKLQFSWAGTMIDPTSVRFRPLAHDDAIEVADTVYPGQKPQHLYWNIESNFEGQLPVEVCYFTSGLTWQMDYTAITDAAEERMLFRGYVRVFNKSGEEYDNAQIRLIVGKINLVEKIAAIARRYGQAPPRPTEESERFGRLRKEATRQVMDRADGAMGEAAAAPKQIVKEGVSEYFMFSIDGRETVPDGWSKRMIAVTAEDVAFDIVYRMRAYQYGARPVRFFIWPNDAEHNLGDSPLPDGQVRIFRENAKDGLAFVSQQKINYVPITDKIEINCGPDDLVVYEPKKMSTARDQFHFHWVGG
ncbi:MAG: hypothetical protein KGY99_07115, partial [Phycisphaerae bacterium]|nr:hypothetical protein [Phycisphaerae bacterium]